MNGPRFRRFPLLPGGHLQTMGGHFLRLGLRWPLPTEDVVVEAGDGVRILLRASWQREENRPALLVIHGLEGCDRSPNVLAIGLHAYRAGWHVVRMNLRGCGDSLALCPRLYNAGLTSDLVPVLRFLAGRVSRFGIAAFSLGGNLTLLTLARERDRIPDELFAVAAICPPLDMSACADALERRANRIYQLQFVTSLNSSYRKRQKLLPDTYESDRERGVATVREFDDRITAFYGGYQDAEDYYRQVSPGPRLGSIDRRSLVLAASDDPFIPEASMRKWPSTDSVTISIVEGGGHVGFVGPSKAPGYFWAADRVLAFLEESPRPERSASEASRGARAVGVGPHGIDRG